MTDEKQKPEMQNEELTEKNSLPDLVAPPRLPRKRPSQAFIAPLPGYEWNPLLGYPRNLRCPCLSGRKFKACCLPKLPQAVTSDRAEAFREQMKKPDLVFMTNENKERIEEAAKRGAVAKCKECDKLIIGPHDCDGVSEATDEPEGSRPTDFVLSKKQYRKLVKEVESDNSPETPPEAS